MDRLDGLAANISQACRLDLIEALAVETPHAIIGYAADRFDLLERAGHLKAVLAAATTYTKAIVKDSADCSPVALLDETAGLEDTAVEIVGAIEKGAAEFKVTANGLCFGGRTPKYHPSRAMRTLEILSMQAIRACSSLAARAPF